jgi:hypothetical protein
MIESHVEGTWLNGETPVRRSKAERDKHQVGGYHCAERVTQAAPAVRQPRITPWSPLRARGARMRELRRRRVKIVVERILRGDALVEIDS